MTLLPNEEVPMSLSPQPPVSAAQRRPRRRKPKPDSWQFGETHLNYVFGQKLEDATRVGQMIAGTALVLGLLAGLGSTATAAQSALLKTVAAASILSFLTAFLLCLWALTPAVVTDRAPLEPLRIQKLGWRRLAAWLNSASPAAINQALAIEIHAICVLIVRRNRMTRLALFLLGLGISGLVATYLIAFLSTPAAG